MPVQAQRGGRGIAPRPRHFTSRKNLVPIVQEAGWDSRASTDGMENSPPSGIWYPNCPGCTKSLYLWCYPGHLLDMFLTKNCMLTTSCEHYTGKFWRWGHLTSPIWYSRINGHLFNTCTDYWRLLLSFSARPFKCQLSATSWNTNQFKCLWWENILPFQTKSGYI
jgi:hypothetical protein